MADRDSVESEILQHMKLLLRKIHVPEKIVAIVRVSQQSVVSRRAYSEVLLSNWYLRNSFNSFNCRVLDRYHTTVVLVEHYYQTFGRSVFGHYLRETSSLSVLPVCSLSSRFHASPINYAASARPDQYRRTPCTSVRVGCSGCNRADSP